MKSETKPTASATPATPKRPARHWGLDGDVILQRLQKCKIGIATNDGATLTGRLVGYNEFTLSILHEDGLRVYNKGAVAAFWGLDDDDAKPPPAP
jgi:hypothetical protein